MVALQREEIFYCMSNRNYALASRNYYVKDALWLNARALPGPFGKLPLAISGGPLGWVLSLPPTPFFVCRLHLFKNRML